MVRFDIDLWVTLVDNRMYDHSEVTRMVNSYNLELNIPFTDHHVLAEVRSRTLFRDLEDTDAWKVRWGGDVGWLDFERLWPDGARDLGDFELRYVPPGESDGQDDE